MQPVFNLASVHRLQYRGGVDADGHVLEAADLWDDYIEARYHDRALRMRRDADGLEYLEIDGKPSKRTRKGYPAWRHFSRIRTRPTRRTCPSAPATWGSA